MAHPPYNPSGAYPGPVVARGLDAFSRKYGERWVWDAGASVYRWTVELPIFDLRPGLGTAYGNAGGKVNPTPINHEAALGLNIYLNVLFYAEPTFAAPATIPKLKVDSWEDGNPSTSDTMYRLSRVIDITDIFQAGGDTAGITPGEPQGGSLIAMTPCVTALRFWRPRIRLTIPGVVGVLPATKLGAWASLH